MVACASNHEATIKQQEIEEVRDHLSEIHDMPTLTCLNKGGMGQNQKRLAKLLRYPRLGYRVRFGGRFPI